MNWSKHYTRTKLTLRAGPENGRTYEVVSTGITNPVKVYQLGPEYRHRKPVRALIATVPTMELGILSAEQFERWAQNRDRSGEDQAVAERARWARDRIEEEPRARFVLTVPVSEMITTQENLAHAGLHINLEFWPEGSPDSTTTLPLAGLFRAIRSANEELEEQDLQPRIPEQGPLAHHSAASAQHREIVRFLQTHYRWGPEEQMLENRWAKAGRSWEDVTAQWPELFPHAARRAA